jgi:molecular chaperone GrpE
MTEWHDDDRLLADFRQWFETAHSAAALLPEQTTGADAATPPPTVGLADLIGQLTALRHEVKLETKAARGLQEQNTKTLDALQRAVDLAAEVGAAVDRGTGLAESRTLAEALAELDEALQRGRVALDAARRRLIEESAEELGRLRQQLDELFNRQAWWRRRLCRHWHDATKEIYFPRAMEVQQEILASLVDGYALVQKRLQKALQRTQIRRIEALGKPVNPQQMNVVEVVDDPYLPPGQVVDEIRPGYVWRGDVLRCAEVKAVRER